MSASTSRPYRRGKPPDLLGRPSRHQRVWQPVPVERGDAVRTLKARRRTSPGQARRWQPAAAGVRRRRSTGRSTPRRRSGGTAPLVARDRLRHGRGNGGDGRCRPGARPAGRRGAHPRRRHAAAPGGGARACERAGGRGRRARRCSQDPLGPASLDEVRVFFPDPWPKARHPSGGWSRRRSPRWSPAGCAPAAGCTSPPTGRRTPSSVEVVAACADLVLFARARGPPGDPLRAPRDGRRARAHRPGGPARTGGGTPAPGFPPGLPGRSRRHDDPVPSDPHDGLDPSATRRRRRRATSGRRCLGAEQVPSSTPVLQPATSPSLAVDRGTSGGDPLSGAGASAQDLEDGGGKRRGGDGRGGRSPERRPATRDPSTRAPEGRKDSGGWDSTRPTVVPAAPAPRRTRRGRSSGTGRRRAAGRPASSRVAEAPGGRGRAPAGSQAT